MLFANKMLFDIEILYHVRVNLSRVDDFKHCFMQAYTVSFLVLSVNISTLTLFIKLLHQLLALLNAISTHTSHNINCFLSAVFF
jgi:hypothetical protein